MSTMPYKVTGVLAVAALGPYAATETEIGRQAVTQVTTVFVDENNSGTGLDTGVTLEGNGGYGIHALHEIEQLNQIGSRRFRYDPALASKLGALPQDSSEHPTLSGRQIKDLREVLRFDINPDWVINRFSRVSTVLADLNLKGLRVPIVTGIRADDVAGTLTFYFDNMDRLQRLTFHGFTGDKRRFSQIMVSHYGMKREPTLEAGVYTKRWNGLPVNFMRLAHAPVVYSDAVHQKYTVFLELNQPSLPYGISREARKIVDSDHQSGRW